MFTICQINLAKVIFPLTASQPCEPEEKSKHACTFVGGLQSHLLRKKMQMVKKKKSHKCCQISYAIFNVIKFPELTVIVMTKL